MGWTLGKDMVKMILEHLVSESAHNGSSNSNSLERKPKAKLSEPTNQPATATTKIITKPK